MLQYMNRKVLRSSVPSQRSAAAERADRRAELPGEAWLGAGQSRDSRQHSVNQAGTDIMAVTTLCNV